MNYPSPRTPGSTPAHEWEYSRMSSATPTPSPRPSWHETPRRPATRAAHSRVNSYSQSSSAFSPRPPKDSPRYNSSGQYSTVDVSAKYSSSSSRDPSGSFQRSPRHDRRYSYTYVRSSTPYGESDEDEVFEALGRTFVLPAQSSSRRHRQASHDFGGRYTNYDDYAQGANLYADPSYGREFAFESTRSQPQPQPQARAPTSFGHRRSSTAVPQRSQTVRPGAQQSRPKPAPSTPRATDEDARRHGIPVGYSLKNWDPNEEPILLLGSVFDANNLGKWIYDWTVYRSGPNTPIAEMAGDLWLLLIQVSGKFKRAEEAVGKVRNPDNRELVNDFVEAGERLMEKLRSLLKLCEQPMLKAAKKKQSGLGKTAGVEFVDTLFGRDRELSKTEKLMQHLRTYNMRFDANCEEVLRNPTI
ncbi:hypothetical protein S7711_08185 [Stachybotrys chartarum IBT 7711]|uniref:Vegetative cell wall protein gp1 n=1 Tax=Stachybotrys chartarum (strain CBS 109288 / IBT 7711) TaxID=1280523 RepID=A0A084ANM6_STACB|nr:hypothetical protein S7711_08185 [Stachybotrys chartarum IBT 7711]KFA54685.1 hypothetical protein S40293_00667 [Stachybotrys chartarum IBT 40293]KFA80743.1 hypothetical protein S40288_05548 [Stachybotrys chartarum IBT 40288]